MSRKYYVAVPRDRHAVPIVVSFKLSPTVAPELPNYTFSQVFNSKKEAEYFKSTITVKARSSRKPLFELVGA